MRISISTIGELFKEKVKISLQCNKISNYKTLQYIKFDVIKSDYGNKKYQMDNLHFDNYRKLFRNARFHFGKPCIIPNSTRLKHFIITSSMGYNRIHACSNRIFTILW